MISLSKEQKAICEKQGTFVVRACAGSGKTLTISYKLVKLIKENNNSQKGIATLSFTNVAWKEIRNNLNNFGITMGAPNFLGTIDSFINEFIFFRYYYLLDEFNKRPLLVGYLANPWKKHDLNNHWDFSPYFDDFSFNQNGDLFKLNNIRLSFQFRKHNKEGEINKNYIKLCKMKKEYFSKGYVTQADINYFSFLLLKKYPFISKIIANKFSTFLIDEAQDTNELQMSMLDCILNQNKSNFVFIGDFNQSIFEWNGAKPDVFDDLCNKFDVLELDENWRSSQKICDFASKFTKFKIIAANSDVKDFAMDPIIISTDDNYRGIVENFNDLCCENQFYENKILVRSNNLFKKVFNCLEKNNHEFSEIIWENNLARDIIYSKFLFDNHRFNEAFECLGKVVVKYCCDNEYLSYSEIKEYIKQDFFNFKHRLNCLFSSMPNLENKTVKDWFDDFLNELGINSFDSNNLIQNDVELNSLFFEGNFEVQNISTIHKVKGNSFDAILLILNSRTNKNYSTLINEFLEYGIFDEELRLIYVAITRPRKLLVLAVPNNDKKMWEDFFEGNNTKQSSIYDFF